MNVQDDWHGIDISKMLEQQRLAFHDWHSGFRPQIAQAQNRRAVRNHAYQIVRPSVFRQIRRVLGDGLANGADARAVISAKFIAVNFAVIAQRGGDFTFIFLV